MTMSTEPITETGRTAADRHTLAWVMLAALGLYGALALPFFRGRVYTIDDLGAFHLPLRHFYAQCLATGEPFDWLPYLFSGMYISGEGQGGMHHPWHLLLYRYLPLRGAFGLELLLNYPLAAAGMYAFLRRREVDPAAALFGGIAFAFGGANLLRFMHPNATAVMSHVPWLLWMWDISLRSRDRRHRAVADVAIAVATGSQLLLGHPQYVWFSLLAEGAYAVFVRLSERVTMRRLCAAAVAKMLGIAIGAVQLLPSVEYLAASTRQSVDADFAFSGSMHPLNLVQLVAPYLFDSRVAGRNTHELTLYCGAVPLLLVVWLLACRRRDGKTNPLLWAGVVFAGAALVAALGKYSFLYALQTYLPVVGKFRFPCRHAVLFELSVAAIAAIAFSELSRAAGAESREHRRLWPVWAVVVLAFLLAVASRFVWDARYLGTLPAVFAGPAILAVVAALVSLASNGHRWALIGLVVATAIDLGVYGLSYSVLTKTADLSALIARLPEPPGEPSTAVAFDLARHGEKIDPVGNRLLMRSWRRVDGYVGLQPARELDYRNVSALRAAGAGWVRREAATGIASLISHDHQWHKVPDPMPRARLVREAVVSRVRAADLKTLELRTAAIVDEPIELSDSALGRARILADRPGRIRLLVETTGRQLLCLTESYHAGWTVLVDNQPGRTLRANGDFLAALVERGRHDVEFRFQPASLWYGKAISTVGIVIAACLFGIRIAIREPWALCPRFSWPRRRWRSARSC